jgi:DNA-binding NtrC family response regulator
MPPLRSRLESLPELLHHFLERASNRVNKTLVGIDERAIMAMRQYHWPGNIRELQNIIERAAVLTQDNVIRLENLPVIFAELALHGPATEDGNEITFRGEREKHVSQVEAGLIKRYLRETGGNVSAAARQARIPRRTFYRLLSRYGISGNDFQRT